MVLTEFIPLCGVGAWAGTFIGSMVMQPLISLVGLVLIFAEQFAQYITHVGSSVVLKCPCYVTLPEALWSRNCYCFFITNELLQTCFPLEIYFMYPTQFLFLFALLLRSTANWNCSFNNLAVYFCCAYITKSD